MQVMDELVGMMNEATDLKWAHQRFEEHALRNPEQLAVACGANTLSYLELNGRADQLADSLRALGVGPNSLVAIALERSVEMAVAVLATLKAGAAYVPLDPAYPVERLAFMLEDSKPQVLLTQSETRSQIPGHNSCTLFVEKLTLAEKHPSDINAVSANDDVSSSDDLAYVIYTSGSTGQPKGVMITHGNLASYVESMRAAVGIRNSDVYLHTASISFSSSVRQLMLPLSVGASVVIATTDEIMDPPALFELIKERRVTIIDIVPSYWRSCIGALQSLPASARARLLDNDLRLILSASEPLLSDLPRAWRNILGHPAELINMFGQTETAGIVATHPISINDESGIEVVPLGRPINAMKVYLLDDQQRPIAPGGAGEICLGGPTVGRGYLNQPVLTAEKFVDDPFAACASFNPGTPITNTARPRLYRTGDLGRLRRDGTLEFAGRIDSQVKIRGHRVEPVEIEAALLQDSRIREAAVIARTDEAGVARLVAYVTPQEKSAAVVCGRPRYQLPNNLAVVQQNKHETDFFYRQIFVDQTNFKHGITLHDGATVFDVGANIGMFTLFVQQLFKNVKVFAFEPIPAIYETLCTNVSLYGDGVRLFECGLADETKPVEFTFYPNSSSQSGRYADETDEREVLRSIINNTKSQGEMGKDGTVATADYVDAVVERRVSGEKIVCQLRTLSEIIRAEGIEHIDLLKIDVEKSEGDVLAGIADADWSKIQQIVIEAHDVDGNLARLLSLLRARGYQVVAEQDDYLKGSSLYNLYATRPDKVISSQKQPPYEVPVLPEPMISELGLRRQLQAKLPEYLIPASFMILETLPRLPNGKIDRQSLLALKEESSERSDFEPAHNPTEAKLSEIWSAVLKREAVSVNDNFFDLGGDSILVTQIISRAAGAGLHVTPKQIFKHQTIAQLSAALVTVGEMLV